MLCEYCGHEETKHSKSDGPCEECEAMPRDTTAHRKAWHLFEGAECPNASNGVVPRGVSGYVEI